MHAEIVIDAPVRLNVGIRNAEEELASWIRDKKENLLGSQNDFHTFHLHMRDLERMLLRGETESAFFESVMEKLLPHELALLNNLYCMWETHLERRFVHFLDNNVVKHYLDYPLYARFERLIDREVKLLADSKPKKLLFIGSGPMPITALCLQHRLGIQIDCLERFQDAVDESRTVMKKLGMEGAINVMQGFGEEFDVSEYDAVLVALLAKPKRSILENILRTCKDDVSVVCRTSDGSRCVFYEPTVDNAIPPQFSVKAHARAGVDDTISSVLLKKALQS